ncbi:MAG: hypothetical protein M1822_009151 [Bathelium mastoideum]|nr:MAG: hypothetical protein M1822_009151 [Bathelium mastoideum]
MSADPSNGCNSIISGPTSGSILPNAADRGINANCRTLRTIIRCAPRVPASVSSSTGNGTVTPRPTSPARSSAPVSTIGQTVADSIWQTLDAQDATREAHLQTHHSVCQHGPDLSPWLEMTQWPRYLNGQRLSEVAPLAHPAQPVHEPLLHLLVESLDRIVEQAHREICDDRINVFDQTRINCFLPRPRAFDRPIMVKLQKATYRRYVSIWKRLLCFIYRTVVLDPSISLPHQLTSAQGVAFDRLLQRGREVLAYPEPDPSPSSDPLPSPTRSPQERGAFSPDGKQIASASDDTTVRVWDVERGGVLHTLEGHSNGIAAVAFSPDGKQIASASDDTTVRVWDVERGGVLHTLEGHSDRVTAVAFSPDGKQIASASDDTTVRVWDVERGGVLHTLEGHLDYVIAVAFSPDGKQIASASGDKTVRVWNAEKGSLVDTLSTGVPVSTVMFSADGSHLEIDLGTLSSPCLASYSHQKASTRSPKLFVQERWVFIQGRKVLWLPPKYVITCIAVHGSIVVMGHASGRVIIMEFGIGLMEQDD